MAVWFRFFLSAMLPVPGSGKRWLCPVQPSQASMEMQPVPKCEFVAQDTFSCCPSCFYRHLKHPSLWLAVCVCVKLSMRMTSWYLCYFLDVFSPWSSGKYLWCSSPRGWWIGLCGRLTNIHPARSTRKTGEKLCGEAAWESSYSLTLRCFHCLNVSVLCFVITEQLWKKWVSWDTHRDIWFTQQSKSFSA